MNELLIVIGCILVIPAGILLLMGIVFALAAYDNIRDMRKSANNSYIDIFGDNK